MRKNLVRQSLFAVGLLGLLGAFGCDGNLQEAALVGLYDFVSGTVSDTLGAVMPIADAFANGVG